MVVRKLSFLFTYVFINIGFSPWLASVLSVFVALAGSILLMLPNYVCVVIGMILVEFWLILDCVDGNIARCKKESSEMGSFIDALSGYYISAFVYLGTGVAAYNFSPLENYKFAFVIIGAISAISGLLSRLIHQKYTYTIMFLEKMHPEMATPEEEVENKRSLQYIRSRMDKEIGISGLFMPFLIVSAVFNLFGIITVFYCMFQVSALLAVTAVYSLKAR
jgi:phosphatidylglycerophosphate synthase